MNETEKPDQSMLETEPAPAIQEIVLSEEQTIAVEKIQEWLGGSQEINPLDMGHTSEFKLGGYAGTGKTTIIKTIMHVLKNTHSVVVIAFTGKACHVLQKKGIPAQTIHSLIYEPEPDPANPAMMIFHKRNVLDGQPDLIIVDEASMVSTELYNDLKSYGIPILFVGDPGQLEPVGDNPNLMKEPDYVLSKIHRQAERSPIITFAQSIRCGGVLLDRADTGELWIARKHISLKTEHIAKADQVICAKNKTRQQMNTNFRLMHGRKETIEVGEKIIVLRNNVNYGVFNGMILNIVEIVKDRWDVWDCKCTDDMGNTRYLPVWKQGFDPNFDAKTERVPRKVIYCDYAYVITCHKSQGSEWKHVFVIDEPMSYVWSMPRWRYTAITRAAERLVYSF